VKRSLTLAAWALAAAAAAQTPNPAPDHGAAALWQSLLRLRTTASFLQVTAHPDDEDGGLLTMLSRGRGVRVGLLTLTRGEGGQNKIGPELFDRLGITRTEELLAADRYYGVPTQMFTRAVDYGYSKTLAEALEKWRFAEPDGGPVVADVVRAIRRFRPEVFVARFNGTARDGHAHHQASSIIARKAFQEAGDPSKFPEQLREGLLPWRPKKMYVDNVREAEDWTVREDVGVYAPLLGQSYAQLAWQGLSHQRTQGVGQVEPDPGPRPDHYKRIDGTPLVRVLDANGRIDPPFAEGASPDREAGFFDGLDESLPGVAARLGAGEARALFLRPGLVELERVASRALEAFDANHPEKCAPDLARGLALVRELSRKVAASGIPPGPPRAEVLFLLDVKASQFEDALAHALSLDFRSQVEPPQAPGSPFPGWRFPVQTIRSAVPGEWFLVSARFVNRSADSVRLDGIEIEAPAGWTIDRISGPPAGTLSGGEAAEARFRVRAVDGAAPTAPDWHRASHQDPLYRVDDPARIGRALPDFPLRARADFEIDGVTAAVEKTVQTRVIDPLRGEIHQDLPVEPAISVATSPSLFIVPLSRLGSPAGAIEVELKCLAADPRRGRVEISAPEGWSVSEPREFTLAKEGDAKALRFDFTAPRGTRPGTYAISARALAPEVYDREIDFLDHPGIGSFPFLAPARTRVVVVEVRVPPGLRIGYVRGAEDAIPDVLSQLGVDVHELSSEDLAKGDLSTYSTIVTGPRAYDVREDLRKANARLLEYVRRGGRLVVQYNSNTRAFNEGGFLPFPASFPAHNERVTVEDSPVEILDPGDPIWSYPNRITASDFDGWVQERGLYFLGEWSAPYRALLSMHDPGDPALRGSLVMARVGRGTYIFTGLSWFRELPEGVPGAIRIFVNLICPGPR
jgi:LmbE family N-acetylglucosaminyl deacetylase